MSRIVERGVACPSCWETHTLLLDGSEPEQTYIEDCSICCHPMTVTAVFDDGELAAVTVEPA